MDKKALSERDICTKFITAAIEAYGWHSATQFLEEVNLTSGQIVARLAELRALCAQLRDRLAATAQTQCRLAATLIEKTVA